MERTILGINGREMVELRKRRANVIRTTLMPEGGGQSEV